MSGREHEPVAAFFPSIDRNLILDLDRHLRGTKLPPDAKAPAPVEHRPEPTPQLPAPAPAVPPMPQGLHRVVGRPDIAGAVEAVEHAAHSIAAMSARIGELENHIDVVEAANRQLEAQLAEARQTISDAETALRDETDRALRNETAAAQNAARVGELERDLAAAQTDLSRVTDAIASALINVEDAA